jgi:hypothetical protein
MNTIRKNFRQNLAFFTKTNVTADFCCEEDHFEYEFLPIFWQKYFFNDKIDFKK